MKFKHFLSLLVIISIGSTAFAISVDRIVIVPRGPDLYVRNITTALNTKTGETLVVWETHPGGPWPQNGENHEIWGQLLQPDGKPIGSQFRIISSSSNPRRPHVIYNPDTDQFVLVYSKWKPAVFEEVYAIRLKPTGRRKGKPVLVSHPHNPAYKIFNGASVVFYDSENKSILILFERYEEGPPDPSDSKGIYGAILDSNLKFRKQPIFVQSTESGPGLFYGPFTTDIKLHEPTGKLLLGQTLMVPVTFQSECLLTQLDPTLSAPVTVLSLDSELQGSWCGVRLMQVPNGKIISLFSRDDGTKKRKIDSAGAPTGSEKKFFAEPLRSTSIGFTGPAFASSDSSKEFAVLGFIGSEIETAEFWLQRANAKGTSVGSPILIESGVDSRHGGIITALPSVPSKGHLYAVLYIEGERDQPPLDNQGSGLVLLRVNTAP